jgi:hypothetical protein
MTDGSIFCFAIGLAGIIAGFFTGYAVTPGAYSVCKEIPGDTFVVQYNEQKGCYKLEDGKRILQFKF